LLLGLELLVIGLVRAWRPWSWSLLATLPFAFWFLWFDQRNLRSVVTVLLDELAREMGLTKIFAGSNSGTRSDENRPSSETTEKIPSGDAPPTFP
jgi:hypothetical protein